MRKNQSLLFCINFDPCFPMQMAEIEEWQNREKIQPWPIQICQSPGPFLYPLKMKNKITFIQFMAVLDKKTGFGPRLKGQLWSVENTKSLVPQLSTSVTTGHKGHFRNILTLILKFGYFSWYHTYILEKYKLNILMKNLKLNQLALI